MPLRLLILGGTGEATELARKLSGRADLEIVSSLAGRTGSAPDLPGRIRVGGFGGIAGLTRYIQDEGIGAVIDATHPFAARMAANAAASCAGTGVPRLKLLRPEWEQQPGDRWIDADSAAEAAARLPSLGKRVFLTVGVQEIDPFARRAGCFFLIRLISAPNGPLPADHELLLARPPFSFEEELALMRSRSIDLVVSKQSGGPATYAKILAARQLGLPVLMVRRPPVPPGLTVATATEAEEWIVSLAAG